MSLQNALTGLVMTIPALLVGKSGWDTYCANGPPLGETCVDINNSFNMLRDQIESAKDDDVVVFCPFNIQSNNGDDIMPSSKAAFFCETEGACTLSGTGQLINYNREEAETIFYGFTFSGATSTAIHIRDGSTKEQRFCKCTFEDNASSSRGGAIRTSAGSTVKLYSTSFIRNKSGRGGAIYNRGHLEVADCQFQNNEASEGGAIANADYATLSVKSSTFEGNVATDDGPVIWVKVPASDVDTVFQDLGQNLANDNGLCDGLWNDGSDDTCYEFQSSGTESPSASNSPSYVPSLSPSDVPSSEPSAAASEMPSMTPSVTPSHAPTGEEPSMSPAPTDAPSISTAPTEIPSSRPTGSVSPSSSPSTSPSSSPSAHQSQSMMPSGVPSMTPTATVTFQPTPAPIAWAPPPDPDQQKLPLVDRNQPRGYFNFNVDDGKYGPDAWEDVRIRDHEYKEYEELGFKTDRNECGRGGRQSPIDLHRTNTRCEEFHQIRARGGNWRQLTEAGEIEFQVTPRNLRIRFLGDDEMRPRADSPGGFVELYANHLEVHTPSLHTFNGKRFDAEYSIYHVHGAKNRVLVLSVVIDAEENVYNHQFQRMLNAWGRVRGCGINAGRRLTLDELEDEDDDLFVNATDKNDERRLQLRAQIGGKHNIYHVDLVPSIHWYAYSGSLVQPPCTRSAHWRVYDTPMKISHQQLIQLRQILANGPCRDDPMRVGLGESLVRPTQNDRNRDVWRCTKDDFLSDCERFGTLCPAP